jgi:hypothetical protein
MARSEIPSTTVTDDGAFRTVGKTASYWLGTSGDQPGWFLADQVELYNGTMPDSALDGDRSGSGLGIAFFRTHSGSFDSKYRSVYTVPRQTSWPLFLMLQADTLHPGTRSPWEWLRTIADPASSWKPTERRKPDAYWPDAHRPPCRLVPRRSIRPDSD